MRNRDCQDLPPIKMAAPRNVLGLYRYLLRRLSVIPQGPRTHYMHRIKQEFKAYSDETDTVRIQQIMEQSVKDIEWIINKVN